MKIGVDYIGVVVVFFCHDGRGNYLLAKRTNNCRDEHGRWDPGGGAIEFGETVDKVLEREIREEYTTTIKNKEFLGFRDVHREHEGKKTHWIALDFRVEVDRAAVSNGEPHKFEEIAWFAIDNLPKPIHSQFSIFYEQYKDRL